MSWYAKPYGGYTMRSTEGTANIFEIHYMLERAGYTIESQAGIIGNMYHESALNPWRWQGDSVNEYYGGYGLFQYTPSSNGGRDRYIGTCEGLPYYAPSMSTSYVSAGAKATDAICQVNVFIDDYLSKWVSSLWRSYWPDNQSLRNYCNNILSTYGSGYSLSQYQFSQIDDVTAAAVAFLGCFEGPAVPNAGPRIDAAAEAYEIITGAPPDPGPTPDSGGGNTPSSTSKMPIWLMLKPYWKR